MNSFSNKIINPFIRNINFFPNNNSFFINGILYTYGQLKEKIVNVIDQLNLSNNENDLVGIVANDDIETYASIWALWFNGRAYVPIHPNQPIDRIIEIFELSKINLLLDSSNNSNYYNIISVINTSLIRSIDLTYILPEINFDDQKLAYLLFTSGSTGKPKGVSITRGNLGAFVESMSQIGLNIDSNDKCIQPFDLTFDFSVSCYLLPLIYGACVYTVPIDKVKYLYIVSLIENNHITILQLVPSMIRNLQPYFKEITFNTVKYCIFCGEALHLKLAIDWSKCVPNSLIYNLYGPTEDTVFCSYYILNRQSDNKSHNGILSIGKPLKNVNMIICDDNNNIIEQEEIGELCLSGEQLTPGYWMNDNKNKEAFFINKKKQRYYRTGDVCYYDREGDFFYVERTDQQTKINGFRVELGEIEFFASAFLQNTNLVSLPIKTSTGIDELVLVIQGEEFDVSNLKQFLKTKLPSYMVPSVWKFVKSIPLNQNGKIDRKEIKRTLHL